MKKIYFLVLLIFSTGLIDAQIINFPDAIFKAKLLATNTSIGIALDLDGNVTAIDANGDGNITISEALNISKLNIGDSDISSLEGIEYFTNLKELNCYRNNLTILVLDNLQLLENLNCWENEITNLSLVNCIALENMDFSMNNVNYVDWDQLGSTSNLKQVSCRYNDLTVLDMHQITSLTYLNCAYNSMESLILSTVNPLTLSCENNNLVDLDLSNCRLGPTIIASYNFNLMSVNVKNGYNELINYYFILDNALQHICADEGEVSYIDNFVGVPAACIVDSECALNAEKYAIGQFNIYPNPAHNILNVQSKENLSISAISIYNTLGQLALFVPNANGISKIDVSTLKTGNYYLKVISEKGTSNIRFIKN